MAKSVNLIIALHNHQPVGNLEDVLEFSYRQAYEPFLEILNKFSDLKICLHYSGVLLEWLERAHPKFITRIGETLAKNQGELIGGGFADPILTMLNECDRIGQIKYFTEYIKERFNTTPKGMWLAERVWEQNLTKSLADADMRYTMLDDYHFKAAGLLEKDLKGYFITEDQCRTLLLFPIAERLRYAIPFQEPEATIEYLRHFATDSGDNVMVYADDGEKFGSWPKTHQHCYEDKWLERFFKTLQANKDWIKLITFTEAIDQFKPIGRIYLPDCSYREMTEWALPVEAGMAYEDLSHRLKETNLYDRAQGFMKGGFWRNFKVKYPEINLMHSKMCEISGLVGQLPANTKTAQEARIALYRAQNNCPYWHGVFGGFYLPHLRTTVYQNLIKAENIARQALAGKAKEKNEPIIADFDNDLSEEIKLSNESMNCYFKPAAGGALYELDIREKNFNALATLARRQEAYHYKILRAQKADTKNVQSIHDLLVAKEQGLENLLYYDNYPRRGLLDHFFDSNTNPDNFAKGNYDEQGDFIKGAYNYENQKSALILSRDGHIRQNDRMIPFRVAKQITFARNNPRALEIRYKLTNLHTEPVNTIFGVESNYAMLAGNAPDRFYYDTHEQNLGPLITHGQAVEQSRFGLKDLWQKIGIELVTDIPARVWFCPVQTVSQSEMGFESIYQSSVILLHWPIQLEAGKSWQVKLTQNINFPEK